LFRAKAINAFVEFCLSPNQKMAELEQMRTIKYLGLASKAKKDMCGTGKYKYVAKHLPLLRHALSKSLTKEKEGSKKVKIHINSKLKELSEFAQNSYDHEQLLESFQNGNPKRQEWARLHLQLGSPNFADKYSDKLEKEIKKEYEKIFKKQIREFELDYLAELVSRVDLGLIFSSRGENKDPEDFFRVKSMRLIYDCIYEADNYSYDRHSLIESINAAKHHSEKKEEYYEIFEKSQLYELLIARLCSEEVQVQDVEFRLEEDWFTEQRERLEQTINIVCAPEHTNTEIEFLEHTLKYHTGLFGVDLNSEILAQQSKMGFCTQKEFQKFPVYDKIGFLELQAMELFCNALRENRDFQDWESHSVKGKFHTIEQYLDKAGKDTEYSIMISNPQVSLDLLKYHIKNN